MPERAANRTNSTIRIKYAIAEKLERAKSPSKNSAIGPRFAFLPATILTGLPPPEPFYPTNLPVWNNLCKAVCVSL